MTNNDWGKVAPFLNALIAGYFEMKVECMIVYKGGTRFRIENCHQSMFEVLDEYEETNPECMVWSLGEFTYIHFNDQTDAIKFQLVHGGSH